MLELLPQHAVVVNVSRGTLLDEGGLLDLGVSVAQAEDERRRLEIIELVEAAAEDYPESE